MTEQANIATVRRMYEEVFNQDRPELVDELAVPNFKNHAAPPGMQDGSDTLKAVVKMLSTAFPDDRHEIEDIFAYGDRVACRVRFHGTHAGAFLGAAPSGKHVSQEQMHIIRLEGGRWVEHWAVRDDLDLLRQMTSGEPAINR